MDPELKKYQNKKFIGTLELAHVAANLISDLVPKQERGSVTDLPDERMVRYYIAEELLQEPDGKQGTASVYGYQHLLQLLVIKRMQAEHFPIRKIREFLEGKQAGDLEILLGIQPSDSTEGRIKNQATEYLESLLKPSPVPNSGSPPGQPKNAPGGTKSWARIEVEPGLEIHISTDYKIPKDAKSKVRLVRIMMDTLENSHLG